MSTLPLVPMLPFSADEYRPYAKVFLVVVNWYDMSGDSLDQWTKFFDTFDVALVTDKDQRRQFLDNRAGFRQQVMIRNGKMPY